MTQISGQLQIKAFLSATRQLVDPNRPILTASPPYIISGSIGAISQQHLVASGLAASAVDADIIHLEFERGSEADGPTNVVVAADRGDKMIIFTTCRFWCDPRGRPFLIASAHGKKATMSFDPDGLDSNPGAPDRDLRTGYARAQRRLHELYLAAIAANDFGSTIGLLHLAA